MCTLRSTASWLAATAGILSLSGAPVLAGSARATLAVGVTVARSCAVASRPLDQGTAAVELTCASGAASHVMAEPQTSNSTSSGPVTLRLQTTPFPELPATGEWQVVTVQF